MTSNLQGHLFNEEKVERVGVVEVASRLGVSVATVRNWVKTGHLEPAGKGWASLESVRVFQEKVGGVEKLTQRANKSLKDRHDELEVTERFLKRIMRSSDYETLGREYESSLADSYRNAEGIYYTPKHIVERLFADFPDSAFSTFCDPCCGSGNFVVRALELGFKPENIFAFDTDPVAVELTRRRVHSVTGFDSPNIIQGDFLQLNCGVEAPQFDCIYTNPPWGKKGDKKSREEIGGILQTGGTIDTCSLFFFSCLKALNEGGTLGLLLPEAFFNVSSFEAARLEALRHEIEGLIDFEKPFQGLVTKAQGIVIRKVEKSGQVRCETTAASFSRSSASFERNPKSIFNFHVPPVEANVLRHVFSLPHITLRDKARWGLGIVTGNNKRFVGHDPDGDVVPVFKGSDITPAGLKEPTCFISADLSQFQQVAPLEVYEASEKLMYKFISKRLCFYYDDRQRYALNSVNFVIPDPSVGLKMNVICELFNSDYMNWLFSCIFNTHKILRSDIESLPIHTQFLNDGFIESEYLDSLNLESSRVFRRLVGKNHAAISIVA